jgi:ribosomal RNA-processing protein 36
LKGKKPYYLRDSSVKLMMQKKKFEKLKQEGKLEKFLQKKKRKKASNEHKFIPTNRKSSN